MTLSWPGAVAAIEGGSGVAVAWPAGIDAASCRADSSVVPLLVKSLASVCMILVTPVSQW